MIELFGHHGSRRGFCREPSLLVASRANIGAKLSFNENQQAQYYPSQSNVRLDRLRIYTRLLLRDNNFRSRPSEKKEEAKKKPWVRESVVDRSGVGGGRGRNGGRERVADSPGRLQIIRVERSFTSSLIPPRAYYVSLLRFLLRVSGDYNGVV